MAQRADDQALRVGGGQPAAALDYVSPAVSRGDARRGRRALILSSAALVACVAVGMGLTVVDDASNRWPRHVALAAMGAAAAAALAILAIGAAVVGRARVVTSVAAVVLVLGAVMASQALFDASPLRQRVGWIRGDETVAERAADRFAQRAYLCWAPTLMVGAVALLLGGGRRVWLGWLGAMAAGLASAVLWGAQPLPRTTAGSP